MALIKSISGIRGTIGGEPGTALTPLDIVHFVSAYATMLRSRNSGSCTVVTGRDARVSGEMVSRLVTGTLTGMGIDVIELGFATTPTVEIAVKHLHAHGGIIITASHNPGQWNALKLLNAEGEFISAGEGAELLRQVEKGHYKYATADMIAGVSVREMDQVHIQKVLNLKLVDVNAIRKAGFKVAIDCVNSVGGLIVPQLLKFLGVAEVIELYCEPTGHFPHNPEPLPAHLGDIASAVVKNGAQLGFVVDPDVDRLAIVNEDGTFFGEEYTLVAVADYVLKSVKGDTVSNLSSSRALRDITVDHGGKYHPAPVGEVNVVEEMKRTKAVIGGEGNGGIIYPPLHYGRDALVGIALFLSHLARSGQTCSELRKQYPDYYISKNKIEFSPDDDIDKILAQLKKSYSKAEIDERDGIKIDFEKEWVHLRRSNTEPVIRIISESNTPEGADLLAKKIIDEVKSIT